LSTLLSHNLLNNTQNKIRKKEYFRTAKIFSFDTHNHLLGYVCGDPLALFLGRSGSG
jgi:hypothetical protein